MLAITDPIFLLKFAIVGILFGSIFFYALWSLVARRWLSVNPYDLLVYMAVGFMVAVYTEPIHDYVYRYFFGEFLWTYQVWPIFSGASSGLAFITWPFYGYHLYFFTQTLHGYGIHLPVWLKGSIPALDGVPFDIVVNGTTLFFFNIIFFYYPRPELWHLSSWWVMPFYFVSGMIYAYTLRHLLARKKQWCIPLICYAIGCLGILIGDFFF